MVAGELVAMMDVGDVFWVDYVPYMMGYKYIKRGETPVRSWERVSDVDW